MAQLSPSLDHDFGADPGWIAEGEGERRLIGRGHRVSIVADVRRSRMYRRAIMLSCWP